MNCSFLYVDDGVLPFLSRSDALLGSEITLKEISRLGLTMHVDKGEKSSKTEAFFPLQGRKCNLESMNKKKSHSNINLPLDNNKEKYKPP